VSEGRKMLISVLVVIVTLGGVGTWLGVGMQTSEKLEISIKQKGTKLAELQEKIAAVPALRQEQQKLSGELQVLETILPNDRELNKIFDTLSEYEKEAGLEIRRFNPVREKTERGNGTETSYRKVSYDLELVGEYFSLVKFLNLLENHKRFVQVDSFNIKQKDEDSAVNELSVKCSTFVFDPKANSTRVKASRRTHTATTGTQRKAPPEVAFDLDQELAKRYVFQVSAKRRDPFTNPLTRRLNVAKFKTPDPAKLMTPGQEKETAETIQKQLAEVGRLVSDGKLDEADKLLADTRRLMDADFRDPETVQRHLGFSRRTQRLGIILRTQRGEKLYKLVQENHDKMLKAFESGDYDEVYQLRTIVTEMVKEGGADLIHDRLTDVVRSCQDLCKRADARREFAGIGIDIQGTFWSGSKGNRKAAAIINNQVLVEGERVKADVVRDGKRGAGRRAVPLDAEIIIKKIDRDKVTFLYKDELIDKFQFQSE